MTKRKRRHGFTLIEVMYSVGLLSIALLGVIATITYGMMTADMAGNFSAAAHLGQEVVEIIRTDRTNLPTFGLPPNTNRTPVQVAPTGLIDIGGINVTPRQAVSAVPLNRPEYGLPSDGRFSRNIQITPVTLGRFNRIQVRIYWTQNGKEKMVETIAYQRSGNL